MGFKCALRTHSCRKKKMLVLKSDNTVNGFTSPTVQGLTKPEWCKNSVFFQKTTKKRNHIDMMKN